MKCKCNGMPHQGRMCKYIKVGLKKCGTGKRCEYQIEDEENPDSYIDAIEEFRRGQK